MNIGRKIKELRKKQDITQEKLAIYLNISYQAVSKWENGTAFPDITLIPTISNFFGITADELFGMKESEQTEELKEYEKIYHENRRQGKILQNIELSREVLKKHPRNYQWMLNLAYSLSQYNCDEEQIKISIENHFLEEATGICERILEDCTDNNIRHSAVQLLCYNYPKINNTKRAIELANTMPDYYVCRESLLEHIYQGEERLKQIQENLISAIDNCCGRIYFYSTQDIIRKELTPLQIIELLETANSILRLIFKDDGNYLFYNDRLWRNYYKIAEMYVKADNKEKAWESLLLAEKYAVKYDKLDELGEQRYNSLLTGRCTFNPQTVIKNGELDCRQILLNNINNNPHICKLKEHSEFTALMERLNNEDTTRG